LCEYWQFMLNKNTDKTKKRQHLKGIEHIKDGIDV